MTTKENGGGGRKTVRARPARPDLVVPGERREVEAPSELRPRGAREGVVESAGTLGPAALDGDGGEARAVGNIRGSRKKGTGGGEKRIPMNVRMDPAVHFALKVLVFESGLDQQYLVNVAVRQLCREHGLDPDAIREGKGYTVSFPGSLGGAED